MNGSFHSSVVDYNPVIDPWYRKVEVVQEVLTTTDLHHIVELVPRENIPYINVLMHRLGLLPFPDFLSELLPDRDVGVVYNTNREYCPAPESGWGVPEGWDKMMSADHDFD